MWRSEQAGRRQKQPLPSICLVTKGTALQFPDASFRWTVSATVQTLYCPLHLPISVSLSLSHTHTHTHTHKHTRNSTLR